MIFMFYYNERLMLARKKRDLTQNELSQRLGLKQQQYEKYKKGINVMPITYLYNAWIVLNISANYILGLSDEMNIRSIIKKL